MADTTLDMINNLGTQTCIATSDQTFVFYCVSEVGAPINITGATCSMKIYPYGQPTSTTLTKTGTITNVATGEWKVFLLPGDTINFYSVYQFQPIVVTLDNTKFIPGTGILNFVPNAS